MRCRDLLSFMTFNAKEMASRYDTRPGQKAQAAPRENLHVPDSSAGGTLFSQSFPTVTSETPDSRDR